MNTNFLFPFIFGLGIIGVAIFGIKLEIAGDFIDQMLLLSAGFVLIFFSILMIKIRD